MKKRSQERFRYGWRLICAVWHKNRHCLERGCGRVTFQYWVRETCHVLLPGWFYREVLVEAVKRGWATKKQSVSGHSIFIIKS